MASSSNELQQSGDGCEQIVTPVRDELTNIIRQCVRQEMENQQRTERPGIGNIMHRTRDLIARYGTKVHHFKMSIGGGVGLFHLIFTTPPPRFEVVSNFRPSQKLIFNQPSQKIIAKSQTFPSPTPAPLPEIPVKTMSHAINKLPKKFLKNFSPPLRKDIVCSHSPSKSETFTTSLRNLILPGVCLMEWHQFL